MNYQIKIYENNTWSDLDGAVRPFTYGTTLDETLDEGKVNISMSSRATKIKPFTPLRIYTNGTRIDTVVGSSKRIRRTYDGTACYNWEIQVLEPTKKLERSVIDNMTVTKYLYDDYAEEFNIVPMIKTIFDGKNTAGNVVTASDDVLGLQQNTSPKSPYDKRAPFKIPSVWDFYSLKKETGIDRGVYNGVKTTIGSMEYTTSNETFGDESIQLQTGTYHIKTESCFYINNFTATYYYYVVLEYSIAVFEQLPQRTQPTITSVCERLLSAGITRRQGIDTQKYTLYSEFADKYAGELAPEFSFTSSTLFEALLQVGGKIHAIPRLIDTAGDDDAPNYEVTFDELGGQDEVLESGLPPLNYEDITVSLEDYCGAIDSPAQNLLNTQDRERGAISEPFVTVRCDEGEVEISADTGCIRTSMPIYQVIKLECRVNGETVDITPYVYENAEYQTLTSYVGGAYPYSKEYALVYTQGGNKIGGLNVVANTTSKIQTVWLKYAIVNILKAQGITISETDILNLAFKVTYVPIVSSRITQRKSYAGDYDDGNVLVFNQSANMAETGYYGDKMRGAIMRLGQEVVQRTYIFDAYTDIPQCGQLLVGLDGVKRYISRVDYEFDKDYIRATLMLSKDFNMLAQYVGLDSNVRMYDVSEKQVVERCVHYSENCYLSRSQMSDTGTPIIIKKCWYPSTYDSVCNIDNAVIISDNANIIRPVAAFPFGASIAFSFSMLDNYGADYQSVEVSGESNKRSQRLVPYADGLGEIENLSISYWHDVGAGAYTDVQFNAYPTIVGTQTLNPNGSIGGTGDNPLVVSKDSKEALSVVYQVHFKALEDDIVIGTGLSKYCPLVNKNSTSDIVNRVYLDYTLNKLCSKIDITSTSQASTYLSRGEFVPSTSIPNLSRTYKSWAIVFNNGDGTGEVIVGRNETISPDHNTTTPIFFNLCDNAHKPN